MAQQNIADIGAYLLNALENLGNWFGLGPVIEGMTHSFTQAGGGKKLTSNDINNIIDKLVEKARTLGNDKLQDLNNKLTSITSSIPKSNLYRDALNNGLTKTQDLIKKANNIVQQAEEKLASAKQQAANIDYLSDTQRMSWGGKGRQIMEDATQQAAQALNKFKELEKI